ncbi:MAG TPA: glycosyltransferase [Anaeromyxobacteraceae bacterium]|nr:glycosyltransferase [Anaeromyxobacteraceae bacterium]
MPLVSFCIPTHNMARYLGDAIESALAQEGTDVELVVCDDASTDDTAAIVAEFSDPRLRYCLFPDRAGQAGNFNRCLRAARGDYLTILHSDDLLLPGFLRDRTARLDADPRLAFTFGAVRVIDADGLFVRVSAPWPADRRLPSREMLEELLKGSIVSPPSLMVRRSHAEAAGAFREDLTWGHDWEWTMRLAAIGDAQYAAAPSAAYRVHDGSGTAEMLRAARNGAQERHILTETLTRLATLDPSFQGSRRRAFASLGRRHLYYAHLALERRQANVARNNLGWAAAADPLLAGRPTFWMLLLASLGARSLYSRWARLRGMAFLGGSAGWS